MVKIGINGLGRIGKCVFRIISELYSDKYLISEVNLPNRSPEECVYAIKYDSIHGRFSGEISVKGINIECNGREIILHNAHSPEDINWKDVDIVLECSGKFNSFDRAKNHIKNNVTHVIISAPAKNVKQIVYGVNEKDLKNETVISASSCTTNCLANVVKIIDENFQIQNGHALSVHAVTNTQSPLDRSGSQKSRACFLSAIPSSSGAEKSIAEIFPKLGEVLRVSAVRVPINNVSLIDFTFTTNREISVDAINSIFDQNKSKVLFTSDDECVSVDFNHSDYSAIVDKKMTKVISSNFGRVAAWYDNEYGFASRMIDIIRYVEEHGKK